VRVAVTGGFGFIGSHTVELLLAAGCEVLVVDDLSHPCGVAPPPATEVVEADAGSVDAQRALERYRPEAVLHLASKGGVEVAGRDPAAHVRRSLAATVALYEAAVSAGARRIVSASSGGAVYGDPQKRPTAESSPPAPVSAYGAAKLSEEVYLESLRRRSGVEAMSLRYSNVYGPWQDGTGEAGLVAITATRLARGLVPVVFGDGLQTRDFVYVGDVARANLLALSARRSGVLNVGTGRETSVREVVERLVAIADATTQVEHLPARKAEVRRVALDCSRAARWLGWRPEVTLESGLALTYEHFARTPTFLEAMAVTTCE
jgi:UDP-glucose 4-epimerase